jgi:hypothetical protein
MELLRLDVLAERDQVFEISIGLETGTVLRGVPDMVALQPDVSQNDEQRHELECTGGSRPNFQVGFDKRLPCATLELTQASCPSVCREVV